MRKLEARGGGADLRLEEDIPIVERILMKTSNPKVASVLALDLLLVGIDTVRIFFVFTKYFFLRRKAQRSTFVFRISIRKM